MTQPLPEGLREVGWFPDQAFAELDQLLKEATPNMERLTFTKYAAHEHGGLTRPQNKQLEEVTLPFLADLTRLHDTLLLSVDLRGKGYYRDRPTKRPSFWHSEGSVRSTSNVASLTTWFLVDHRPQDSSTELRALTGSALIDEYNMGSDKICSMTVEELAVFGLAVYQAEAGRIIDYSGVIHRVPLDLCEHPDREERIFARVTLHR